MEYPVLVFEIQIVERREENIVLVNSKKGEGRKKDFLFQGQKIDRISKILCEVDSRTIFPTSPYLSDLGPGDSGYYPFSTK